MKHISVSAFKEVIATEASNPSVDFINVCTPAEYKEKHIRGVRSVPLDELEAHAAEFASKKTIYVHCRSGNRSQKALTKLAQLGITAELVNVEGGLNAWDEHGYDTGSHTNRIPLMRQVLIAAGSLVLVGSVLALVVAPLYVLISIAVGAGLLFAGVTGWCGMAFVLARMPWNA